MLGRALELAPRRAGAPPGGALRRRPRRSGRHGRGHPRRGGAGAVDGGSQPQARHARRAGGLPSLIGHGSIRALFVYLCLRYSSLFRFPMVA